MNVNKCDIINCYSDGKNFNIKVSFTNDEKVNVGKVIPVCYCYRHWKEIHNQLEFV